MKKMLLCATAAVTLMFGFKSDAMLRDIRYTVATVPPTQVIQADNKLEMGGICCSSLDLRCSFCNGNEMYKPLIIKGTDSVATIVAALFASFRKEVSVLERK